jgi:DnaJ-class molecular chaperone
MFFSGGGFPFPPGAFPGGFPGGGFPGGGFGHHHEEEEEDVDTSTLYALLEVSKEATQGEIRKAYLRISNSKDHPRRHPDKGGSAKLFAEVQGAYEILSDADKRARYDRGGESAANREGGGGGPGDLFETLCGGGGGGGRRGPPKAEATKHPLRVTLEESYRGKTFKVRITRSVVRRDPNGNVMDRQQRRYMKTSEQELLEVTVARGAKQGEKIHFPNKGDIQDGLEQGDVVLVVQIVEHPVFQRKGSDLICKRDISLIDAISGVDFHMRSISGGVIRVKSPPGMVSFVSSPF